MNIYRWLKFGRPVPSVRGVWRGRIFFPRRYSALWIKTARAMWKSAWRWSLTISSAVWIQYINVTDGQTDIQKHCRVAEVTSDSGTTFKLKVIVWWLTSLTTTSSYYTTPPIREGVKRWCVLSLCMSDVRRLSVTYIGRKWRTGKPWSSKICTQIGSRL